jgi:hypothetical protein
MSDPEQIVHPVEAPADAVTKAIALLAFMNVAELRSEWRAAFGSAPPLAFSKDLLARHRLSDSGGRLWRPERLDGSSPALIAEARRRAAAKGQGRVDHRPAA